MAGFYVNLAILFITIPRLASKHYQYCFSRQRNLLNSGLCLLSNPRLTTAKSTFDY